MFTLKGHIFDGSPFERFTLLILTRGFAGGESIEVFQEAWRGIVSFQPINQVLGLTSAKKTIAVYCDHLSGDLGLQQMGTQLEIPESKKYKLRDYLKKTKVRVNPPNRTGTRQPNKGPIEFDAIDIWPEQGRSGPTGCLVIVVVKGDSPGELYQISSSPRYPIPLIAVVKTGKYWANVLARGVAQNIALLADEYELPGPEYLRTPETLIEPRPNLITISDVQRATLQNVSALNRFVVDIPRYWGVGRNTQLKFHPHVSSAPNTSTSTKRNGRTQLVEGGGGYRRNTLRCDFDCLMRRKPNSTALPIQVGGLEFCRACQGALSEAVRGSFTWNVMDGPRILLDSQRPLCDRVKWKTYLPLVVPGPYELPAVGKTPEWSCQVDPNRTRGLVLNNIKLQNRPKDPFKAAEDIFELIEFPELAVKFAGESEYKLNPEDAWANTVNKPIFRGMQNTKGRFSAAARLSLTWDIPGHWSIEAVMSVVFKDKAYDFDPGGAALANKMYPQLSMRYRKPPKSVKGTLAKVEWLKGSIRIVANNVIPTNMQLHKDLEHFRSGKLQAILFTDGNPLESDNTYDWDQLDVAEWGGQFIDAPPYPFGLWAAEWQSGRKLAGVNPATFIPSPGATGLRGHLRHGEPILPYWSWLFDYTTPGVVGSKTFTAVFRKGEKTGKGNDGGTIRETKHRYPSAGNQLSFSGKTRKYEMTVRKMGRQGAYDNVHIHPHMGKHMGREIIPAPFCGELCMHLHWRWGTSALVKAKNRASYLGWGNGRLEQGAHSSPGAPLVPPNQNVEVTVDTQQSHTVTYKVRAHNPDFDAYQVFLEQGVGIAYSYGGLSVRDFTLLAGAVEVIKDTEIMSKRRSLRKLRANDPAKFDRTIRNMFHHIYDRLRWYSPFRDEMQANTQQIPGLPAAPPDLEDL